MVLKQMNPKEIHDLQKELAEIGNTLMELSRKLVIITIKLDTLKNKNE